MKNINILNEDCLIGSKKISDETVDLVICDPPFGIGEVSFNRFYKRDSSKVLKGYQEAPKEYDEWIFNWLNEVKRILKPNGSVYVIMGHSNLRALLNAIYALDFVTINHLIWKYNFGVNTKNKFVTSHYHVLYLKKTDKSSPTFNTYCRFGQQEKDNNGGSLLFKDLEDVFYINKDYASGEIKNQNKLPDELIQKLILYSSNENDLVCDFFMGNFTTAYSSINLGRKVCGFEINPESFNYHLPILNKLNFGNKLSLLKRVENIIPINQGQPISDIEIKNICDDYKKMINLNILKKDISLKLQEKYGRGKFSIKNILDKNLINS